MGEGCFPVALPLWVPAFAGMTWAAGMTKGNGVAGVVGVLEGFKIVAVS